MMEKINLKELRAEIPTHCFVSSYRQSLYYLTRDISSSFFLCILALHFVPVIPNEPLRFLTWILYGCVQGLIFTGLWVLGHECGHNTFSRSPLLNNCIGFGIHSILLTPFFSWKLTHRRHHQYTGHIEKDNSHVPKRYLESERPSKGELLHSLEDSPVYLLICLVLQQCLGWPLYLFASVTSGSDGTPRRKNGKFMENSHFNPYGALFREADYWSIIISDIGITLAIVSLAYIGRAIGGVELFLLYGQPFLWLNQWIVAVTYLQHTHVQIPRYEADAWTFSRGALTTVDRDSGVIGRFFLHNVIDYHVVHHLFPTIPFYHAAEATKAIRYKLGENYIVDKRNLLLALWRTYDDCKWVVASQSEKGTLSFSNQQDQLKRRKFETI